LTICPDKDVVNLKHRQVIWFRRALKPISFGLGVRSTEKRKSALAEWVSTVWLCVVWDFKTINFQFTTNFN